MKRFSITLITIVLISCTHQRLSDRLFLLSQTTPVDGPAESIGSYSSGCLRGASSLPAHGDGFIVMRTARGRFWGHPLLTTFIQDLGAQWQKESSSPIIIGDLSLARGGPMLSNHMSHQSGLDVDIWMQMAPFPNQKIQHWSLGERELISAKSVLSDDRKSLSPKLWGSDQMKLLELAAKDARVNRIFVHPLIKKNLCQYTYITKQEWIKKIRPWWGHDDHIHVRLVCPADSLSCKSQEAITSVGCDETLEWWFSEEAKQQIVPANVAVDEKPNLGEIYLEQVAKLPMACQELLDTKD